MSLTSTYFFIILLCFAMPCREDKSNQNLPWVAFPRQLVDSSYLRNWGFPLRRRLLWVVWSVNIFHHGPTFSAQENSSNSVHYHDESNHDTNVEIYLLFWIWRWHWLSPNSLADNNEKRKFSSVPRCSFNEEICTDRISEEFLACP